MPGHAPVDFPVNATECVISLETCIWFRGGDLNGF